MKAVLIVPVQGSGHLASPEMSPSGPYWRPLPDSGAQPSPGVPCFPDNPGPWENMPRRATGGRQEVGHLMASQTTAPGGRWQHEVEVPRAVRPEVLSGGDAGRIARPLPARSPEGQGPPGCVGLPSPASLVLPWLQLLPPSLSSAQGSYERDTGASEPRNPCPSCRKLALSSGPGLSRSPLASPH